MSKFTLSRRCAFTFAAVALAASSLSGCAGENAAAGEILTLDYATYNPLSLVLKEKGWLEDALADDGISVEWIQSAGSNKANEALRADAIDVAPPPAPPPCWPAPTVPRSRRSRCTRSPNGQHWSWARIHRFPRSPT